MSVDSDIPSQHYLINPAHICRARQNEGLQVVSQPGAILGSVGALGRGLFTGGGMERLLTGGGMGRF